MNTLLRNTRPFGFDHLPQDWFSGFTVQDFKSASAPAVNIQETETDFIVSLVAPGFEKENFKLKSTEKLLEVSASIEKTEEKEGVKFTRKEFEVKSFTRSFNLPEGKVNIDDISASYNNGVLNVSIPKRELVKPLEKVIDIK